MVSAIFGTVPLGLGIALNPLAVVAVSSFMRRDIAWATASPAGASASTVAAAWHSPQRRTRATAASPVAGST